LSGQVLWATAGSRVSAALAARKAVASLKMMSPKAPWDRG
jgi:hypothetical protein